jgi:two-component system, LytTR family, response regulator
MIKCVVIDDEPMALDVLEEYIEKIPFLEMKRTYRSSINALEDIQNEQIDLIFLDINMPDLSGIQFLNSLTYQPMIIFTTAYSEYAVESYEYQAVDYLLKPIEFDRFLKATNKALEKYRQFSKESQNDSVENSDSIFIKSGTETHRLNISEILYIESAGNYVQFVTFSKSIMALMTMSDALKLFRSESFIRVHRSFIVAIKHINIIETDHIKIEKKKIPIGDTFRENLKKTLEKYKH